MKKTIIGTIALLVVTFVLMQSCYVDFISSVIPGWHTTILPKLFITRIVGPWLVVVLLVYFLVLKKETSNTTVYIYLFMTAPFTLCDTVLLFYNWFGMSVVPIYIMLGCITIIPFVIAQMVFIIRLYSYTVKDGRNKADF
jgi:hypothetical protein